MREWLANFYAASPVARALGTVLRLADRLEVPLRDRNRLLTAAGYAPLYREHALADPEMRAPARAVERVLQAHEPYPALAVDRHWNMVASNRMVPLLLADLPQEMLAPPVNVLRLSLHPQGLAPRIVNLGQWRKHLLERLRQQLPVRGQPQGTGHLRVESHSGGLRQRFIQFDQIGHVELVLRVVAADAVDQFLDRVVAVEVEAVEFALVADRFQLVERAGIKADAALHPLRHSLAILHAALIGRAADGDEGKGLGIGGVHDRAPDGAA